ncbi:hypothetical protein EIP91_008637 [Steccherinum ochraceum]|uniref:Uncharacterized protein n=1 Tax=Steccherinum ochraceum TaxID=92696 RepID=A0A4R0RKE8_9APHY|nr:hypothetical protein EIP91_008637 [Steccherinum ochraceum]
MSSQSRRASLTNGLLKDDDLSWCDHPDFDRTLQEVISKDETMKKYMLQMEMDEWFRNTPEGKAYYAECQKPKPQKKN